MTKRLLLVTGPKSLGDRTDAEAWTRSVLASSIHDLSAGDVVLTAETHLSAWSAESSHGKIKTIEIHIDGSRFENGSKTGNWCDSSRFAVLSREEISKDRANTLIEYATKARDAGWDVSVISIDVPWSETTDHTELSLAASFQKLNTVDHMFRPPEEARPDVVWLDLETGGMNKKTNPIIEIGAIHTDPSCRKIIRVFETKLKVPPWMWVEPAAAAVNGYSESLWRDAPEQKDGLTNMLQWLPKRFILAGYSVIFDRGFVMHACDQHQLASPGWQDQPIDPLYQVRSSLKKVGSIKSAKLDEVCGHLGIHNKIRHRALADAERARLVHLTLLGKKPESSLFDAGMALYDRHQEAEKQSQSV